MFSRGPEAELAGREGLDLGLAALAFDHRLSVLFEGAGAILLRPLSVTATAQTDWRRGLRTLPLHGAAAIGVDASALALHGLDSGALLMPAMPLDPAACADWMRDADVVLGI